MFNEQGFTLSEVAVAMLIGMILVVPIGKLNLNVTHQRITSDEISVTTHLASQGLEQLLALQSPATASDLTAGSHGPTLLGADGQPSLGPYRRSWTVNDNVPDANSKRLTVTVTHDNNPQARCTLVTYYKIL